MAGEKKKRSDFAEKQITIRWGCGIAGIILVVLIIAVSYIVAVYIEAHKPSLVEGIVKAVLGSTVLATIANWGWQQYGAWKLRKAKK